MNNVPQNIDTILSLLGEVDIIKTALSSFEKSINMALATDEVSNIIGPPGHFHTIRKLEMVQAALLNLNVELLNIAEHLTQHASESKPTEKNDIFPESPPVTKNASASAQRPAQNNPVVNNILEYLDERLKEEDEDE